MKKIICAKRFLAIHFVIILMTFTGTVMAADEDASGDGKGKKSYIINFGGTVYYAGWDPVWKDVSRLDSLGIVARQLNGRYISENASFLYGPLLSFNLNPSWGLSASFLTGRYEYRYAGSAVQYQMGFSPTFSLHQVKRSVDKYDADLLAHYTINNYTKLIFGLKYQGYKYDESGLIMYGSMPMPAGESSFSHVGGAGAGFSHTVPLASNFFLVNQISAQFLGGQMKSIGMQRIETLLLVGGNAVTSFALAIPVLHITLSLGGRFQYQYYILKPEAYSLNINDLFYGAFVSVILSF